MELEVRIPPDDVKKRLRSSMSYVKSILFTPTWRVKSDVAGNLQGNEFRMRVHHAYSNGYTKLLFGRIEPTSYGSRLVIEFRPIRFVIVIASVAWYGVLIPTLVYSYKLIRYVSAGGKDWEHGVAALSGILITLAVLYVVEVIGKRLGKKDEEKMRRHLNEIFRDVRTDPPDGIAPS